MTNEEWAKKADEYFETIALDVQASSGLNPDTPDVISDVLGDWLYDQGVEHDEIGNVLTLVMKRRGVE